jgi:hypothetical protein
MSRDYGPTLTAYTRAVTAANAPPAPLIYLSTYLGQITVPYLFGPCRILVQMFFDHFVYLSNARIGNELYHSTVSLDPVRERWTS